MLAVDKLADTVEKSEAISNSLAAVKLKLAEHLRTPEQVQCPEGLATGVSVFDNFLLWNGLPKGDLTLFTGKPGTGATSLWINVASEVHKKNKWVAWVNSDWELFPQHLLQRNVDLKRLLVVKKPQSAQQLFWILQEMLTSSLFEMIGCQCEQDFFKSHQLQKLKKLARMHNVALVILGAHQPMYTYSLFSLVIDCQRDFFTIRRAAHRPTPFTVAGNLWPLTNLNLGIDPEQSARRVLGRAKVG